MFPLCRETWPQPRGGDENRLALGPARRKARAELSVARAGWRSPRAPSRPTASPGPRPPRSCCSSIGPRTILPIQECLSGFWPNNVEPLVPLGCFPKRELCRTDGDIPSHPGLPGLRSPTAVYRVPWGMGRADLTASFQSGDTGGRALGPGVGRRAGLSYKETLMSGDLPGLP